MKKDKKEHQQATTGIYIGSGVGNSFNDVSISGYQTGIHFNEASDNSFNSVQIISLDAIKSIQQTKIELSKMKIDKRLLDEITAHLTEVQMANSKENAINSYMKLISSLADHVTALTPIWPHLCLLGGSLIS
ncbi:MULTISPECIES: hypothetical protein [Citrobacter freundii complex]|uniref:hypothetical protein n=1 Tax=Citrobacter freundii complex TaxID=1344959 RepID=UPI000E1D9B31|nr:MULTISPECIES: hypothetical protein [Citrobacter freundii complex]RDU16075.1 hypothetical protein DWV02_20800 [Citrobacter freundii]